MSNTLAVILPSVGWFVLGNGAARTKFAGDGDGQFLLRLVFFIALPALVVTKVSTAELSADKAFLPVANVAISAICMGAAWWVASRKQLPTAQLGAMVIGSMILNNAFILPFALAAFDDEAVTDLVLFDVGNSLMVSLVAYPLAYRLGKGETHFGDGVRRAVTAPLTIAAVVGLVLNVADVQLPTVAVRFLEPLGGLVGPIVLLALGILFRPSLAGLDQVVATVAIRMIGGLALGTAVVLLLGIEGDSRTVLLLASASPIGFMAVALSSMADLDRDAAARAISASLLVGIVVVPVTLLFAA